MVGLGTIINTAAILLGGLLGGIFGRFLKDSTQEALTKVCGVSTIFIAISGALPQMEEVENNAMLIVGCLALGALIGVYGKAKRPSGKVRPCPPRKQMDKPIKIARISVFVLGVLFIVLGMMNGGARDVLIKAINICTECIGLG